MPLWDAFSSPLGPTQPCFQVVLFGLGSEVAIRVFWILGHIVWLSGEEVQRDFAYYQDGKKWEGHETKARMLS